MFNKTSIYLLNKCDPNAIVYPSVTGETFRVTREDFPSEEAFLAFKAWSDEDYHEEDNGDVVEDKRRISIDSISEAALSVPSVEAVMEQRQLRQENRRATAEMVLQIKDKLTETQFRRLWMYEGEGKTLAKIAEHEGVAILSVYESIQSAKEKISKKFPKTP